MKLPYKWVTQNTSLQYAITTRVNTIIPITISSTLTFFISLFCLRFTTLDVARPFENNEIEGSNNKDGDKNRIKKDGEGCEGSCSKCFHDYNILLFCSI